MSAKNSAKCIGLLIPVLVGCGGGEVSSGDMMSTSAGGASPPGRVILELQRRPPVQVWAGMYFEVNVDVKCDVDAGNNCLDTVQVTSLFPAFGTIVQVLHYMDNQVWSYTGQQDDSKFVPTTPIQVTRPGRFMIIVQTGPGDVRAGTDPRQWYFDTSQVSVSGSQAVTVLTPLAKRSI